MRWCHEVGGSVALWVGGSSATWLVNRSLCRSLDRSRTRAVGAQAQRDLDAAQREAKTARAKSQSGRLLAAKHQVDAKLSIGYAKAREVEQRRHKTAPHSKRAAALGSRFETLSVGHTVEPLPPADSPW